MAFEPKEKRGKWRALFGNDNPIHLEIGCGKGRFAIGMAEQHPTAAGGEERRGRRGFRSSPLTSKAVFTGVLIRY